MTKGYNFSTGKKGKKYSTGKGKGKGKGKYLFWKEKSLTKKEKKKRDYVFTNITLRTFLKNNNIKTRVSIEACNKIEEITKSFVLDLVEKASINTKERKSKTLSANDLVLINE